MPFIVVVIGVLLIVSAWNSSFRQLGAELQQDIPGFFIWAVAIAAILGLGFIPGLKVPSRWLLALVVLVLVLTQYQAIVNGFQQFASSSGAPSGSGANPPTAAYVAANAPEAAGSTSSGSGSGGSVIASAGGVLTAAQNLAANPLNPNSYIGLAAGFGGLA